VRYSAVSRGDSSDEAAEAQEDDDEDGDYELEDWYEEEEAVQATRTRKWLLADTGVKVFIGVAVGSGIVASAFFAFLVWWILKIKWRGHAGSSTEAENLPLVLVPGEHNVAFEMLVGRGCSQALAACVGWANLTLAQCQDKCSRDEMPPKSLAESCAYAVHDSDAHCCLVENCGELQEVAGVTTLRKLPEGSEASLDPLAGLRDERSENWQHRPSCLNTPRWGNGDDCLTKGMWYEEGCSQAGWTCLKYEMAGWCADGRRLARNHVFGSESRNPELNCCVCGGGNDQGGSCRLFGCDVPYDESLPCQCSPECEQARNCCYDYGVKCLEHSTGPYLPSSGVLLRPSVASSFTFYVYRAETEAHEPMGNINAASLGGLLWHLHNQVVSRCPRRATTASQMDLTRIVRYKVTTKATTPLLMMGMNFGVQFFFDYGQCVGPGNSHGGDWDLYGYVVGCSRLGAWPHPEDPSAKAYHDAVWYSFPGECPTEDAEHKSADCMARYPGGRCATPSGAGDCTYSIDPAGEINIDELVGISPRWATHMDFCQQGCREYFKHLDGGNCIHWWDRKNDAMLNSQRMGQVDEMFSQKFPDLPRDREMAPPPCDWNKQRYYRDLGPAPP